MAASFVRRRLQRRRRRTIRVPRRILDRSNPLEGLGDGEIFERYRFFPATIFFIVDMLKDNLAFTNLRNNPLTPLHQVLVSLRFFATGSFYITIGDTLNVSKSAAGRAIRHVTDLLCQLTRRFISLPRGEELLHIKAAFHKIAGEKACLHMTMTFTYSVA
ncbi:putative nuclease HARBI1 [Saccostrea cucullata]|uniref:putative nuclease HARBI1 n=1 Tax=Saccostrea cuccullata TaxID=36930 RepID=UPI002ED18F49